MKIAVLALQGAFIEHERMLTKLGVESFEVRQKDDWNQPKDGLIIPGGESTTILKLMYDLDLYDSIKSDILAGLPVFGTCAGLILLAKHVEDENYDRISTMDIDVCRNAYGHQLGSFYYEGYIKGLSNKIPMTFIRAPYINGILSDDCTVLAEVNGHIVSAREGNQLVTAFHPELNIDTSMHEYFLNIVNEYISHSKKVA
jgi:5'-phosphate synthase pdxT subunit